MQNRKPQLSQRLTGKAGVGLASFHLARLGHDFVLTNDNCDHGDIWARFGDKLEVIEVKTTARDVWSVSRAQHSKVAWYVFVNITDADCWLLPSSALLPKFGATTAKSIVFLAREVMAMDATPLHRAVPGLCVPARPPRKASGFRRVKKRLATGEVKIYEYDYR